MGVRGLIRDIVFIFIGFRLMIGTAVPISPGWLFVYGLLMFLTSAWFTFERIGILKR